MTPDRKSFPPREYCRGVRGLYLLPISGVVEPHQHLVPFVRRAAYCVTHHDDAIADINRVQHGRQHTNIGLGSETISASVSRWRKCSISLGSAKAE